MKLSKLIDFQNVEALSQKLQAAKASRERFSIEIPERDCANALYAAMQAVVAQRGNTLNFDEPTRQHISAAARWLTDPASTPGLLLCGLCGNGKTTLAQAISLLIGYVTEAECGYSRKLSVPMYTAKEVCRMCAASERFAEEHAAYAELPKKEMIIIDDLGEEPREVLVYGMVHTPVIDLLSKRYAAQKATIITTNLQTDEIREKYGARIYDRFTETLTPIIFENESYRKSRGKENRNP